MTAREYRPEIDGLRAVAVIPVVLFHMGLEWLRGGFLGVDVFFVLSGFLITSIVLDDVRAGTFTLSGFWARRIRRIMPALVVMVGCTLLAGFLFTPRFDHASIGKQAVAALLSVANFFFWRASGDYWGQQAEQMPLLHTWSLSVEEQFYLFFPLAVWAIGRWRPSWLTPTLVLATAMSFGLFMLGTGRVGTFYMLPTRAWELGVGAVMASGAASRVRQTSAGGGWAAWLAVAGLCTILATYRCLSRLDGGVAFTVLGTALVLAFGRSGPCRTILSWPPLVYVGKASYSLYLWHWPFIVFAAHPNFVISPWIACGVAGLAAVASYEWIEKPTRRRPGILPAIGLGYFAVLASAVAMSFSRGEYDTAGFTRPATHAYCYNINDVSGDEYRRTVARAGATHDLPAPTFARDAWREGGLIVGDATPPRVVVLGDSHGTTWSHVIRGIVSRLGVTTSFYSAMGQSPFGGFPRRAGPADTGPGGDAFQQARLGFIERWHPDVVVVSARWSKYERRDVVDLLTFLESHAGRVLLVEQPPELDITDRSPLQWLAYKHVVPQEGRQVWLRQGNVRRYERGRALVRQLAAEFSRCEVVPVADLYARDAEVLVLDGRDLLYLDDDHLTDVGTERASDRIEQALVTALDAPITGETRP